LGRIRNPRYPRSHAYQLELAAPDLIGGRKVATYSGALINTPNSGAPSILNKSYTITAEVTIPEGGAEGMIVTDGGRFGGYGLCSSGSAR
jgi:hypothetical protein